MFIIKDKTVENCWKNYHLTIPFGWNLHRNTLGTSKGLTWISPFKINVSNVYTTESSISRQVTNKATYWSVSFPAFKIRITNKPDDVIVKLERLFTNITSSEDISIILSNGINEIPAFSKALYSVDNSIDIVATEAKISIVSNTNKSTTFIIEIIPEYGEYTIVSTEIWNNILPKLIIPKVTDLTDEVMSKTKWKMVANNSELWDSIKAWYENNIGVNGNFISGQVFANSDLDEITIKLPDDGFLYGEDNFANSNIETINFIQTSENSHFSAPQRLLRSARNLKNINITWANPDKGNNYLCGANTIVDGMSSLTMETYPERFINWDKNRTNVLSETINCTLFQYAFNWSSGLVTIPSYPGLENENTMFPARSINKSFYECSNLVTIGPILDMSLVVPSSSEDCFYNCVKLASFRIKNLNHGNWNFDGISRNGIRHGTLKSLDNDSVSYLFDNLADLTTHNPESHDDTIDKSFKNWSSSYKTSQDRTHDWDYTLTAIRRFSCKKRYSDISSADFIVSTNADLTNMEVSVGGLQEGDSVVFVDSSGNISNTWNSDGSQSITKTSGITMGFKLISSNTDNRNIVTITIDNGLDYTNPRVSSANLYCPVEWEDKITNEMISAANLKGWNIYIDGLEVQSN